MNTAPTVKEVIIETNLVPRAEEDKKKSLGKRRKDSNWQMQNPEHQLCFQDGTVKDVNYIA
jgi:hypothetical protein